MRFLCDISVCGSDGVLWQLYASQNSFNGVLVTQRPGDVIGPLTVADCWLTCALNRNCLAVDYDERTSRCYQFNNPGFVTSRGPYPRVNQFVAERCVPGQ